MATRTSGRAKVKNGERTEAVTWSGFTTAADVGSPVPVGDCLDITLQMVGTLGTTPNMIIEGSNDGSTWATLKDIHGTALSAIATAAVHLIAEKPLYIRPRFSATAGGTPDINVIMVIRR